MHASPDRHADALRYLPPGVYVEEAGREQAAGLRTGQPAFFGLAQPTDATRHHDTGKPFHPYWLTGWDQFAERVGAAAQGSFLGDAVRGFFDNGGERCVVITCSLEDPVAATTEAWRMLVRTCLERLEDVDEVDLVCAPDLALAGDAMVDFQCEVLMHCQKMGDRFAILDPTSYAAARQALSQWQALLPTDGALYFPWIRVSRSQSGRQWVPPCGHVAGIYARTDARHGVHKAPANAVVEGAVDVRVHVTDEEHGRLNAAGINCVRVLPGRGIRVWGARTLSGRAEWRYVNVKRLFLTLRRWLDRTCRDLVFEPNTPQLWRRIQDRLNNYCYGLFQAGALKGLTPREAFYVKCDAETNPPETRDRGEVRSLIGLAPVRPAELVVVRITHSAAGLTMESTSPVAEGR